LKEGIMDAPKQLLGDDSPQTRPLSAPTSLFDINILPARYRRKRIRFVAVLPWLVFILLLAAIYPVGLSAMGAQSAYKIKQNELSEMQLLVNSYQSAANEMADLQSQIDQKIDQRDLITSSYQGLDLQGSNWSDFLVQIEENTPSGITWTTIDQEQNEIVLNGVAASYNKVLELQASLDQLEEVTSLEIESINKSEEEILQTTPEVETEDSAPNIQTLFYEFTLIGIISEEGLR
jgi:Tfp pilus assembly protein PilN